MNNIRLTTKHLYLPSVSQKSLLVFGQVPHLSMRRKRLDRGLSKGRRWQQQQHHETMRIVGQDPKQIKDKGDRQIVEAMPGNTGVISQLTRCVFLQKPLVTKQKNWCVGWVIRC